MAEGELGLAMGAAVTGPLEAKARAAAASATERQVLRAGEAMAVVLPDNSLVLPPTAGEPSDDMGMLELPGLAAASRASARRASCTERVPVALCSSRPPAICVSASADRLSRDGEYNLRDSESRPVERTAPEALAAALSSWPRRLQTCLARGFAHTGHVSPSFSVRQEGLGAFDVCTTFCCASREGLLGVFPDAGLRDITTMSTQHQQSRLSQELPYSTDLIYTGPFLNANGARALCAHYLLKSQHRSTNNLELLRCLH